MSFQLHPIGVVHSPFKEKFSIPRQPGLVEHASMTLELLPPFNTPEYVRDIEQYSHLWLIFIFHQHQHKKANALVRPPRLGGNSKTGVFSTRSSFRPNPIGMSVVELKQVIRNGQSIQLECAVGDLVDGTPIVDIKPYIPYSDALEEAQGGFAQQRPDNELSVEFTPSAMEKLDELKSELPYFNAFITEVLSQDPRPAYKKLKPQDGKRYAVTLYRYDVHWQVKKTTVTVTDIIELTEQQLANKTASSTRSNNQ